MSSSSLPIIDAHFWIERNGEIHDPEYPNHQFIISVNKCTQKKVYKEAPIATQEKAIKMYEEWYARMVGSDWGDVIETAFKLQPSEFQQCFQVAFLEQRARGGRIVFGSQGWEKKSGGIHWEFGGEDWMTLNDFLKDTKRCERCFNATTNGCPCGHAKYCSKECQSADWKTHKLVCKNAKTKK